MLQLTTPLAAGRLRCRIVGLAAACLVAAALGGCAPQAGEQGGGQHQAKAPPAEAGCTLALITQVPLRVAGRAFFTDLGVNGHTANMLIDSGSFISILSADAVRRYDVKTGAISNYSGAGAGGSRLGRSETASCAVVSGVGGTQRAVHPITLKIGAPVDIGLR